MKRKELRALHLKSKSELERDLAKKRRELMTLRLDQGRKPEKNTRIQKNLRRDIARFATIIQELPEKEKSVI